MDFWHVLRVLVPTDIPEYLRKILTDTGFDNFVSLEAIDEDVMKELQAHAEEQKTKILLGHKVLLFKIRDIIRKKGIEEITQFEKDLEKRNLVSQSTKSKTVVAHSVAPKPNSTDLNAEELVLRNRIKDMLKKLSLEEV